MTQLEHTQEKLPLPQNLKVSLDNFVGKFENAFDSDWCQKAINYFEKMDKMGFGFSRQQLNGSLAHIQDTINVNTTRLVTSGVMDMSIVGVPMIQDYFLQRAWQYFEIYSEKFSSLRTQTPLAINEMKIQKTDVGSGYHVWHWEQEGRQNSSRLLNVQLFLNTVEQGGGTEFLYYSRLEPAVQGTLLIYPGNYTHLHRGNPPRSSAKYIINTWIEF